MAQPPVIIKRIAEPEAVTSIESPVADDSFVYVHCYFNNEGADMLIRIWKTTYLIDHASGAKSPLVHAENISIAPRWTRIADRTLFSFLLIFSALPKSCRVFDFKEEIAQPGGFLATSIRRNETDVYHINIR